MRDVNELITSFTPDRHTMRAALPVLAPGTQEFAVAIKHDNCVFRIGVNVDTTAAVQQYKDTRKQALDYNENALVAYAMTLINTDKADDALTVLQANAELDPNHAPTYAAMAQAYAKKNDKDSQIKMLEKAVQLDPNNQQLKRQLDQLKAAK